MLQDVDIRIGRGEFVAILGGNGSGKSTLAKHMNALLTPDEGRVVVLGRDASDPEAVYAIRSRAGMVFQNPDDQLVASLVEDDVAFGPENLGVESTHIAERVKQALKEVGLVGFERHETHALSGGQKQRVAIAGVLAMEPRALILDEASSMLDPRGRKGLMRVCRELNDRGMTIIMITHYMEEAAAADRVVVMYCGQVVEEGEKFELFEHPLHPYTTGLMDAIPRVNGDMEHDLHTIPGTVPSLGNFPEGCRFCTRCPFADERCRTQAPALEDAGDGHLVRCFKPQEVR